MSDLERPLNREQQDSEYISTMDNKYNKLEEKDEEEE